MKKILVCLMLIGCSNERSVQKVSPVQTSPTSAPTETPTPKEKTPTVFDKLVECGNSKNCAFDVCRPLMNDVVDGGVNPGTACFVFWAYKHLNLRDVKVQKDETTPGKVMKNSSKELGFRICASGTIVQISEERGRLPVSVAILHGYSEQLYHVVTVSPTGDLVERSDARFCGIVTGNWSYPNSAGGQGHTIELVGVWDIPENRK